MPVVSLRDVVEALDLQSEELRSCLDPDTGEIVTFNQEEASIAQGDRWEDAPDWMREGASIHTGDLEKNQQALREMFLEVREYIRARAARVGDLDAGQQQ